MNVTRERVDYLRKLIESGYTHEEVAEREGIRLLTLHRYLSASPESLIRGGLRRKPYDTLPSVPVTHSPATPSVRSLKDALTESDGPVIPMGYVDNAKPVILRSEKMGIMGDLHCPLHDVDSLTVSLKWLKAKGIDTFVLNGDVVDSYGLTRHGRDSRTYTISYEYKITREVLEAIREYLGDGVDIHWIAGNHDLWLDRYIRAMAEKSPAMDELLTEPDGSRLITLPSKLRLAELGITYHDNGVGARCGELSIIHGHEIRGGAKYVAAQKLMRMGTNVAFNHHHRVQEWYEPVFGGSMRGGFAIGCMCQMGPEYDRFAQWQQGFAYVEFEPNGQFVFENKKIIGGRVR